MTEFKIFSRSNLKNLSKPWEKFLAQSNQREDLVGGTVKDGHYEWRDLEFILMSH